MSEHGEALIREVRRIAAANPDFVYSNSLCQYIDNDNGGGSCIMGQALFNLGYLATPDRRDRVLDLEGKAISEVLLGLEIEVDTGEGYWLNEVQAAQDGRACPPPRSEGRVIYSLLEGRHNFSEAVQYGDKQCQTPFPDILKVV
ncbi:hypothetical protein MINTMi27_14920 [Mycobacterium intracellulare]|uniref:hypothetical protein n=1 Tax=Mycobacterium intracellulare TaxID=1767 RepID=UPI0019275CB6|nr:hypothetical protein [Mycobacterium intracellulare]BCP41399.1 hypothetical protein MINTMi27_14920 [Mycobacterium intracellulare]